MIKKSYLINFSLLFLSLIMSIIISEIGLRFVLFSNISFLEKIAIVVKQRNANYYADANSEEDFHKLLCHIYKERGSKECGKKIVHPLLGWIENCSPDNYLHNNTKFIDSRRPVLLYGDSFARGEGNEIFFQDILNADNEFSQNHYLLNYGVAAYGLDQIYLLFHESVDLYDNPFVVISLMTEDLDRSSLTYFSGQKPHFKIINNKLVLEKPLIISPNDFYLKYPPQITSYLYRRILNTKLIRNYLPFLRRDEYYKQNKIHLNEKIILAIIKELRDKKLDYVFLIFHHGSNLNKDDWRDSFLENILNEKNVPYIWSKKIILENYKRENGLLFIPDDGHPATAYNKIIADEIKRHVLGVNSIRTSFSK